MRLNIEEAREFENRLRNIGEKLYVNKQSDIDRLNNLYNLLQIRYANKTHINLYGTEYRDKIIVCLYPLGGMTEDDLVRVFELGFTIDDQDDLIVMYK